MKMDCGRKIVFPIMGIMTQKTPFHLECKPLPNLFYCCVGCSPPCRICGVVFFKLIFMSNKPPTRYSPDFAHAKYGTNKWFVLRGIKDPDVIKAILYLWKQKHSLTNTEAGMYQHIQNNFREFCTFSINYCKENNYHYV